MTLCMHSPTFILVTAAGPRPAQGGVLGVRAQPGGGGGGGGGGGAGRLLGRQEHVGRQRESEHGASWLMVSVLYRAVNHPSVFKSRRRPLPREGPSRDLLRDCEILSANLR